MLDLNDKTTKTVVLVGAGVLSLVSMAKVTTLGLAMLSFATGMAYRLYYGLGF
jgi:hypothetical protein